MVKARYKLPEIKKAAKAFSSLLSISGIKVTRLYLYGSYARGESRAYSDIDIAIISPNFLGKSRMAIQENIAQSIVGRSGILAAFEPIGYSTEEFAQADSATFLAEIKRTGISL
jgi:predicted nucleotidyltransferase